MAQLLGATPLLDYSLVVYICYVLLFVPVKVTDIAFVALALALTVLNPFQPEFYIVTFLDCPRSWKTRKGDSCHPNYCINFLTAESKESLKDP